MLAKIKDRQWALADIDWDAPGAEIITDEQRPKLKAFMADLCWIENIGARGFAALAKKAPTPTIAEIYRYFHAEEQRHANAELALMKRWGMLDDGEMPEPNVNIRLAIDWLDRYADGMSLVGARHRHPDARGRARRRAAEVPARRGPRPGLPPGLREDQQRRVTAPRRRFRGARHDRHAKARKLAIDFVGNVASPGLIIGTIMYVPLLNRMRNEIVEMGLQPERLYKAVKRFKHLGERGEYTRRVPTYRVLKRHAGVVTNPRTPTTCWPTRWCGCPTATRSRCCSPIPSWFNELTHEPAA